MPMTSFQRSALKSKRSDRSILPTIPFLFLCHLSHHKIDRQFMHQPCPIQQLTKRKVTCAILGSLTLLSELIFCVLLHFFDRREFSFTDWNRAPSSAGLDKWQTSVMMPFDLSLQGFLVLDQPSSASSLVSRLRRRFPLSSFCVS